MAPTRELAMQITDEIKKFGKYTGIKVATVYGGQGMGIQLDALDRGVESCCCNTRQTNRSSQKRIYRTKRRNPHIVLDEADTMLDMGFIDDIQIYLGFST